MLIQLSYAAGFDERNRKPIHIRVVPAVHPTDIIIQARHFFPGSEGKNTTKVEASLMSLINPPTEVPFHVDDQGVRHFRPVRLQDSWIEVRFLQSSSNSQGFASMSEATASISWWEGLAREIEPTCPIPILRVVRDHFWDTVRAGCTDIGLQGMDLSGFDRPLASVIEVEARSHQGPSVWDLLNHED